MHHRLFMHARQLDAIGEYLRELTGVNKPFEGKAFVIGGGGGGGLDRLDPSSKSEAETRCSGPPTTAGSGWSGFLRQTGRWVCG